MPKLFNEVTNKQGLIVYSGGASTDYGIVVSEAPAFEKPNKRLQVFNIPGRNGSVIIEDKSFDDTVRNYEVWLSDNEGLDLNETIYKVCEWLFSPSGYQRLEDSFEPDVFRLAYFSTTASFSSYSDLMLLKYSSYRLPRLIVNVCT